MSAWVTIPCLVALRNEFNALSPNRDKGADGTIGDTAHTSSSDHTPDEDSRVLRDHDGDSKNEVHALDIDSSGPWPVSFSTLISRIIAIERAKWNSATDRCRLNYVIFNGKIYDKDNNFAPQNYSGSDRHTNHAHFSGRYETGCENDVRPWGVIAPEPEETEVAFKDEKIDVTATTGKELFDPDLPVGTDVSAATVLQLAAIWAKRAADRVADLDAKMDAFDEKLAALLAQNGG